MQKNYVEIAKKTLKIEGQSLLDAAGMVGDEIEHAVDTILACRGKLIVTGVGKSGLIGAKMAATFASTGTPGFFLHPTEALHGDLGMIGPDDVVLAISYSGESEELSSILPHVKRFAIPLIGMTRNAKSTLGTLSDLVIPIAVEKEACPLNIAPTSSTTLTLALGDALAICLMEARGFQKEDFASFHPGGSLGKRLFVKVRDLMRTENLPTVSDVTPVKEAIAVMSEGRLGTVLIVNGADQLIAILSDGDIRRALMKPGFSLDDLALTHATQHPKTIENSTMLASDALVLIEQMKIQLLAVTDSDGHIEGVLHLHHLVEAGIS